MEHSFSIMGTYNVPLDQCITDPATKAEIHQREARARASGGLGALVVILQCGTVHQVMPIEIDSLNKITWDVTEDWQGILEQFVSEGRKDFKPRSTTSRGYVLPLRKHRHLLTTWSSIRVIYG
jgi:hypothetical protein